MNFQKKSRIFAIEQNYNAKAQDNAPANY